MKKRYLVGLYAGLKIVGISVTNSDAMVNTYAEVTANSLNLRSLNEHKLVIGSLVKGDKVTILKDLGDGFVHIRTSKGLEGKSSKVYLKVIDPSNTSSISSSSTTKKIVRTNSLNVRTGPGTSYSKIDLISRGTVVEVLESKGGWSKVKYNNGKVGYCSASYLVLASSSTGSNTNTMVIAKKKVTGTNSLNIRTGPGTSYSKIGLISEGDIVEVLESKGGWSKVKYNNGKIGYCSGSYLVSVSSTTGSNTNTIVIAKKKVMGTNNLNVRTGPGTSYSKIDSISEGDVVEVLESKGGWSKVRYNNRKIGYCSESYLVSASSTTTSDNQSTSKNYNNVVSSYGTNYGTNSNRSKNIELDARKVNGTVIKPGKTFSYKNTVGSITSENGYLNAPIMANGTVSGNGIGGGICQLSSTIYAAALEAGLTNIQSRTHSGRLDYMKAGVDAVISSTTDLKIKNTYNEDIVIYVSYLGGRLTVKFASVNPLLGGKKYEITTRSVLSGKQVELRLIEKKGIFSNTVYTRTSNYVR